MPTQRWHDELREPRVGIMLHYDASKGSDGSAIEWFSDPRCEVSYQTLYGDDGTENEIAPWSARAWHAGPCRPSAPKLLVYRDANSALYALAWAGGGRPDDVCPEDARAAMVERSVMLYRGHRWTAPTCTCPDAPPVPCTVLDPFNGRATTGVAALTHGRHYVGVELHPASVAESLARLADVQPLLAPTDHELPATVIINGDLFGCEGA